MQGTEALWLGFLTFCGPREPDDVLAVDFVLQRVATAGDSASKWHSQRDLRTLQRLLTWRARNTARNEFACADATPAALKS